jgi:murein L,D-transpeptidase YcbB/YkuD
MACWDAAQLLGAHGPERRRALVALAAHPLQTLDAQAAEARFAASVRALWVKDGQVQPAVYQLDAVLARPAEGHAPATAIDHQDLRRLIQAAAGGDRPALKALPDRLSDALAAYAVAARTPAQGVQTIYADASVAPVAPSRRALLEQAVRAPSFPAFLQTLEAGNGLAEGLRQALAACRAARTSCDAGRERLLLANYERARALPADLGARYILVNVPAQRLWMVDHGGVADSMPVVVGKLSEPTPELAAVVRWALYNPYWNVPPDLARALAPKVVSEGPAALTRQHLQVMSDWTPEAHVVDPSTVDWSAVAGGAVKVRLRQEPGPDNMMGAVKFELPNRLGIYLHDTPHRGAFRRTVRAESAGCIRLQDSRRLARWLLGPAARAPSAGPEARVAIQPAVPVYITYLTARVEQGRVVESPDLYGRDAALIAAAAAPVQEAAGGQAQ